MKKIYVKKNSKHFSKIFMLIDKMVEVDVMSTPNKMFTLKDEQYERSFKSGIKPLIDKGLLTENEAEWINAPVVAEEVKVEEVAPKVEEVAVEEPKIEEPKIEEPKQDSSDVEIVDGLEVPAKKKRK